MNIFEINTENLRGSIPLLRAGDRVILSGAVYTARDAAHKRIFELLDKGGILPFDINGAAIYYAGPTPAKDGMAVGACGPTTSARLDPFTPRLLDMGLTAVIGKGDRGKAVIDAIVRNKSVYLCAIGGAGALVARHVSSAEQIAFHDLGCEAINRLEFRALPLTVAIDSLGGNIFG